MNKLKDMLIKHEGFRSKPYRCTAGKLTIGIGRNLDDRGITMDEALYMLDADLKEVEYDLSKYKWFLDLDSVRQDVLIDMCLNLGITKLLKFTKMIEALIKKDYQGAASQMLASLWAKQVGNRAQELANMMITGKYV